MQIVGKTIITITDSNIKMCYFNAPFFPRREAVKLYAHSKYLTYYIPREITNDKLIQYNNDIPLTEV